MLRLTGFAFRAPESLQGLGMGRSGSIGFGLSRCLEYWKLT